MIKFLSVTGFIVISVGWLLHTPIPEGYKKPWQVHLAFTQAKLIWKASSAAEVLGLGTYHGANRNIWNTAAKLQNKLIDDGVKVTEEWFDGVRVLVYTPPSVQEAIKLPGLVYIHGGAWFTGSPETHESLTRFLAKGAQIVVASVDYRLAPEHVFPADVEDCVTATTHFLRNAGKYGVDPERVAVGGDSAGGQLSAAVTLRMREMVDSGLPVLKLQVLLYPGLQMFNLQSPSGQQNHDNAMLPIDIKPRALLLRILGNLRHSDVVAQNNHVIPAMKKQMSKTFVNVDDLPAKFINKDYTPWDTDHGNETVWRDLKDVLMNPYCCSLIAEDLTNLPAAYIFTGENDVIRDDGFWYAKRLRDAGVDVTHRAHPIAFHGIFNMLSVVDEAEECAEGVVQYIKDNI